MSYRILQVINNLITGGAEKLVSDSILLLQNKGVDVDLLLINGSETPLLEKLRISGSGQVYSLSNGSIYNPVYILKLMKYLKEYDLVHVHLFPSLYWVALAKLLSRSKTKLVYTEHSTTNRRRKNIFFKIIDKIIYRQYDKIVTISDEVNENLKKHLAIDSSNIKLIYNGIDIRHFRNAKPYSKSRFFGDVDDKFLIQVSSFREQKDQPTLIKSLTLLPDEVKLLLVGDGKSINECKQLAERLNVSNRVKFLGIRMDVPQLLKTADIVVLSSYHEGLSLSSIEGMSSGNPFISSDVPGLRDIVSGAGLLFERGNEKELAALIQRLINDPTYYSVIAERCLRRAKNYEIGRMIDQYVTVYDNVLFEENENHARVKNDSQIS